MTNTVIYKNIEKHSTIPHHTIPYHAMPCQIHIVYAAHNSSHNIFFFFFFTHRKFLIESICRLVKDWTKHLTKSTPVSVKVQHYDVLGPCMCVCVFVCVCVEAIMRKLMYMCQCLVTRDITVLREGRVKYGISRHVNWSTLILKSQAPANLLQDLYNSKLV